MSDSEANLKALFDAATKLRDDLDALRSTSAEYQDSLRAAIAKYEECETLTSQLSLFSPNETLDDLSTTTLRYLSPPFHLGTLYPRVTTGLRTSHLRNAQSSYTRYLSSLDDYNLLPPTDRKFYERFLSDRDAFTLLATSDPAARRETKIVRYQQEKALKQKLDLLAANPLAAQNDETTVRELRLTEIALHTHETFQSLDMISQELKILSLAPPAPPDTQSSGASDTRQPSRPRDGYSERLDASLPSLLRNGNGNTGPILSKSGRPLQPFTLLHSRQRLRDGVFRPGHNLPTMSIDEYLAEERKRGGIIDGGGEADPPGREVDEDDIQAADAATMKAREWDEFVEANPKGSGNTLNRG